MIKKILFSNPIGKIKYYNYWKYPNSHGPKIQNYIPILTSRGCPYGCDFCVSPEITGRNWSALKPEKVVNQIEYLKKNIRLLIFCRRFKSYCSV